MSDSADRLAVIFARRLRAEEMAVPTGSVALFVSALSELDLADRDSVYWAGRAVLVKRPEDIDTFDRISFGLAPPTAGCPSRRDSRRGEVRRRRLPRAGDQGRR